MNSMNRELFNELSLLFEKNGFSLFLVGGAVRDFLLKKENNDFDFVSDALPNDIKKFFPNGNYSFEKFGSCKIPFHNNMIDIVTLRKEEYDNLFRTPKKIIYTNSLYEDSLRRDFTINALYMDKNNKIYDFHNGINDLNNKIIKTIGDPNIRFKEDPLRMLRCIRFSLSLNFKIDQETEKAIFNNLDLLKKISYQLIFLEINKMKQYNNFIKIKEYFKLENYIYLKQIKRKMDVIDLHADTITKCFNNNEHLFNNDLHVDIQKLYKGEYLLQCLAIFLNKKDDIKQKFKEYYEFFMKEYQENQNTLILVKSYDDFLSIKKENKIGILLSIEEGDILDNDLSNLDYLYSLGIRMITLSWNYDNCLCNQFGLTPFGKDVVKKMNQLGMIIDVSHANDKVFLDVINCSTKPVIASHSNCRNICNVKRNLSDEMLKKLVENGGLIGINLYKDFVGENLIDHFLHLKNLGYINHVGLGTDFDGIENPVCVNNASEIGKLSTLLKENGFNENEIRKIFYQNFQMVIKNILK